MPSDILDTCKSCSCTGFSGKAKGVQDKKERCRACRHTALEHRWEISSPEVLSSPQPASQGPEGEGGDVEGDELVPTYMPRKVVSPIEELTFRRHHRHREFKIFEDPSEEQVQVAIFKGKKPEAPPPGGGEEGDEEDEEDEGNEDKESEEGQEKNALPHSRALAARRERVTLTKIMEHLVMRADYADAQREAADAQNKAADAQKRATDELLAARIGKLEGQMEGIGGEVRGVKDVVVGIVDTLEKIVNSLATITSKRSTRSVRAKKRPAVSEPDAAAAERDTESESSAVPSVSMPPGRRIPTEEYRFDTLDSSFSSSFESLPTTSDEAGYLPEVISPPAPGIENDEGDTTGDELDAKRDPSTTAEASDEESEDPPTTPVLQLHSGFVRVSLTAIKEESSGERAKAHYDIPAVRPIIPTPSFRLSPHVPKKFTFYDKKRPTAPPARPTSPTPKTPTFSSRIPTFSSRIPTPRKRPARDAPEGANTVHKRAKNAPESWQILALSTTPAPESPTPTSRVPPPRKRHAHDAPEGSIITRKRMKSTPSPPEEGEDEAVEDEAVVEAKTAPSKLTSSAPLARQRATKPLDKPSHPTPVTGKRVTKAAPQKLSLSAPQARHTVAKPPINPGRPPPAKGRQVSPARVLQVPPPPPSPPPPRPIARRSTRGRLNGNIDPTEVDELHQ